MNLKIVGQVILLVVFLTPASAQSVWHWLLPPWGLIPTHGNSKSSTTVEKTTELQPSKVTPEIKPSTSSSLATEASTTETPTTVQEEFAGPRELNSSADKLDNILISILSRILKDDKDSKQNSSSLLDSSSSTPSSAEDQTATTELTTTEPSFSSKKPQRSNDILVVLSKLFPGLNLDNHTFDDTDEDQDGFGESTESSTTTTKPVSISTKMTTEDNFSATKFPSLNLSSTTPNVLVHFLLNVLNLFSDDQASGFNFPTVLEDNHPSILFRTVEAAAEATTSASQQTEVTSTAEGSQTSVASLTMETTKSSKQRDMRFDESRWAEQFYNMSNAGQLEVNSRTPASEDGPSTEPTPVPGGAGKFAISIIVLSLSFVCLSNVFENF